MVTNLTYCATRRTLEQRYWVVVSRFFSASTRLLDAIGKGRLAFAATRNQCDDLRKRTIDCKKDLLEHRTLHGC